MNCRNKDTDFMINCGIQSTLIQQKKRGLNKLELKCLIKQKTIKTDTYQQNRKICKKIECV